MNFFGDRKFYSNMLRLAIPIALQNLLVSSFTLVDTLMVGQLGDTELAAVGMAGQWSWLLQIVLFGIVSGMSMFVAQYWGEKNIDGIHKVYGIAVISGTILSLIFVCTAFFMPERVMMIFNREQDVIASGASYLRIVAFSYPAVMLGNIMFALLRSTECVKVPMVISLIATFFNAVFNYGLIFGKLGLPEMGIEGAALATCISSWVSPIAALIIAKFKNLMLNIPLCEMFKFGKDMLKSFYIKAAPVIINESMWGLGSFVITLLYSNLGSEYYAAVTVLKTFENIAFTIFIGICNASCVMIGKSVGSGKTEEAVTTAKRMTVIVPLFSIVVGAVILLFRENLVHLFNLSGNLTELTRTTAVGIMSVYACAIPVRNIPYIQVVGIFRPGGETLRGLIYEIACLWCIAIPATAIAAYALKLPFVIVYIIMYISEDIPKSILCIRYFLTEKWIRPVTQVGREGLERYLAEKNK